MHFALLREHVRNELGADPSEIFDEFETEAFAAASLGQVHRARLKRSGLCVAVKIQYPDIARTIASDLRNMKLAGFPLRVSGDWENLLAQFEGIQRMLEQETDYEQEAELQETARHALAPLDDVVVPRVVREHSTRRVLTTEYVEGLHLEPFLATRPSQEVRDRHGAQLTRASMRLWYRERLVYADPHPGNYLFLRDGRLGLLDFGCCHRFRDDEFAYVMEMERAAFAGDDDRLVAALAHGCDLKPHELRGERLRMMREYCGWLWAPLRSDEPFDYGAPDQYRDGVRLYGEFVKRRWVRSQPINVWLNKVFFGVRAMLTRLDARVAYGRIMREENAAVVP
jgi:predicted unusual protein kinase regulating ubiquinone biosynthesis (AarF/ABC1/UbiB family)